MRYLCVLLALLALAGCGFIYIPTGTFDSANTCVPESYAIGKRLKNEETGKIGTITALHGRHQRCQVGTHPILATVEYE